MTCPHCGHEITDEQILKATAQIMRAKQGPEVTAIRRAHMATVNASRERAAAPCTCGRTDGGHTTRCAAYSRWVQAKYRAKKRSAAKGDENAADRE